MGPRSEDLPGQIEKFLTDLGFGDGNIQIGESKVINVLCPSQIARVLCMSVYVKLFVYCIHRCESWHASSLAPACLRTY